MDTQPEWKRRWASVWAPLIALALCAAIACQTSHAVPATYFVAPTGQDSNPGTDPARPWRTVARVNAAALWPGDTVRFQAGGRWRETLTPRRGGTAGHPVTITRYAIGPAPIISGSDLVSGWKAVPDRIFQAPLAVAPRNVYVDGGPGWGLRQACCLPGAACNASGSCAIGPLADGSWYYDSVGQALYLKLGDGSNPARHRIEAAVRLYGMEVIGDSDEKAYLVVDGLAFERIGGWGMYFYSNDEHGRGLSGIVVRHCLVRQTGCGLMDDGSYQNGIHFSQARELPSAPQFIANMVSYTGTHGNGFNVQNADRALLADNRADHFNHHGLDTKHSNDVIIRDNIAHDGAEGTNGIYQEYSQRGLITGNLIYDLSGDVPGRGSGIQLDAGTASAHIEHNLICHVLTGMYLLSAATVEYNRVEDAVHAVLDAKRGGRFQYNNWGTAPVFYFANTRLDFAAWRTSAYQRDDTAQDSAGKACPPRAARLRTAGNPALDRAGDFLAPNLSR